MLIDLKPRNLGELSQEELNLLQGFRQLDGYQQKRVLEQARQLLEAERAQKDNPPAND